MILPISGQETLLQTHSLIHDSGKVTRVTKSTQIALQTLRELEVASNYTRGHYELPAHLVYHNFFRSFGLD